MLYAEKKISLLIYFLSTTLKILMILFPVMGHCDDLNKQQLTNKLFSAVSTNSISNVRLLITKGADINATNQEGLTPAGLAIERGFYRIAHYIVGIRNQTLIKGKVELPLDEQRSQSKLEKNGNNKSRDGELIDDANIKPNGGKNVIPVWPEGKPNPFSPTIQTQTPIITRGNQSEKQGIPHLQKTKNGAIMGNSGPLQISNMAVHQNKKSPTPLRPIETKEKQETTILETILGKENLVKSSAIVGNSEKLSNNHVDDVPLENKKDLKDKSWWKSITNIF